MARLAPIHWRRLKRSCLLPASSLCGKREVIAPNFKVGISRPVVIPTYDEVPVSVIKNNLKTANLTRDDYFRLLQFT